MTTHTDFSSLCLLNNLAVTFPPSPSIFPFVIIIFFLLTVSKEDNFSTPWDGGAELGLGWPGAHLSLPSLLCSLLRGLWERGRGSGCRGWSREGRRGRVAWVTLLLGCLGPQNWLDLKLGSSWGKVRQLPGAWGGVEDREDPYWALAGLGRERRGLRNLESRSSGTGAAGGRS